VLKGWRFTCKRAEENNLDRSTEMKGAAGGENLPLGPPKGRLSMLPQFQRHEENNLIDGALEAEQRNAAWHERPDRSSEGTSIRIAVSDIHESRTEWTALAAPNCSESH